MDLTREQMEQRAHAQLRAYRNIIHLELRDGRRGRVRFWRNLASSAVADVRLLRSIGEN